MSTMLDTLARLVTRRPGRVVVGLLLLTVLFGFLSTRAQEATGELTLSTSSEAAVTGERIAELFGQDDQAALSQVAVRATDVLSPEGLATAIAIRTAITTDPAIAPVLLTGPDGGAPVVTWADPLLGAAASQGIDPLTLDDEAIDTLFASILADLDPAVAAQVSGLVSADADTGMVIARLDATASDASLSAGLLAFGDLDLTVPADTELFPFNGELLDAESQEAIEGQMGKLLGLAMLLIVLILIAINRNVVDVVSSMAGLVMAIVWMNGIGALLGPGFLNITDGMGEMAMAIPILLVGLGVDYGIHLASRYREERRAGDAPAVAAGNAIGAVGTALTLATITTVVGFLTNLANPLAPLQDFGILAAVGVVSAFLIMTAFVPAMRLVADNARLRRTGVVPVQSSGKQGPGALGSLAAMLAPIASARPLAVLSVAGVLTVGAGLSATGLSTEFSQTEFFPSDSRALETVNLFQEEFGGDLTETTSVLVEGEVVANAAALDAFVASLADNPDVRTVDGVAQARTTLDESGTAALVTINTSAADAVDALEADLRADATSLTDLGLEVALTSDNLLVTGVMDDLRDSQVSGLLLTLAASMAILAAAYWARRRAPMLGVLAIASVGIVTVWVLGVMAATGIPFNMMTAMISALAIGIGVPFGIHVVNRFLEEREKVEGVGEALRHTLEQTGGALVGSALTTIAGFGVLSLSTIRPMRQFGIVTAMTIGFALIASVAVLPAMLVLWDRRSKGTPGAAGSTANPTSATDLAPAVG